MSNLTRCGVSEGFLVMLCNGIAVVTASSLVFASGTSAWFGVNFALVAPIIAALSFGSTLRMALVQGIRNIFGFISGGLLFMLWLLVLRTCSSWLGDGYAYNEYAAVGVTTIWLFLFHLFIPTGILAREPLCMIFLTLSVYCGDIDSSYTPVVKAILAGIIGGTISILVTGICYFFTHDYWSEVGARTRRAHVDACWMYWDHLVDDLISPPFEKSEKLLNECPAESISAISQGPHTPAETMSVIGCLSALRSIGKSAALIFAEDSSNLSILKSASIRYYNGTYATQPTLSNSVLIDLSDRFTSTMRTMEDSPPSAPSGATISWRSSILNAARFSIVFGALGELLVYWDAQDDSVDTYAFWSLVPAYLLADRLHFPGQAVLDGSKYLLTALLGCALGILCLVIPDSYPSPIASSLPELIVVVLIGISVQAKFQGRNGGELGTVFTVSWIVVVLGNFGIVDSASSTNSIWRVALYRTAITTFAIFTVAASHLFVPSDGSAQQTTKRDLWKIVRGLTDDKQDAVEDASGLQFLMNEYQQRLAFCRIEAFLTNRQSEPCCPTPNELENLIVHAAAWRVVGSLPVFEEDDALSAVTRRLSTGLCSSWQKRISIKPETRELMEALRLGARGGTGGQGAAAIARGIVLVEFAKSLVRVESCFDIHEDVPTPLASDTSGAELLV